MIPAIDWLEIVPRYCGAAIAATPWAEPLIAAANLAFLVTAVLCADDLRKHQNGPNTTACGY